MTRNVICIHADEQMSKAALLLHNRKFRLPPRRRGEDEEAAQDHHDQRHARDPDRPPLRSGEKVDEEDTEAIG
ncbi:MAG: hypothetical protein R3E97_03500 [Candidatus Eisenbacteria bacterium]